MKFKTGMDTFIASLTLALVIGAVATAQQQSGQQGGQKSQQNTSQQKQDASTNPDRASTQTDNTRGTEKDRDLGAWSDRGMYTQYRRHWDARFHDPAFKTYQNQQLEQFNANRAQQQPNTAARVGDRAQQPRNPTSYEQFSQDSQLWRDRNSSLNAWQRSDAYWRMSDRYWRDPARRQADGFDDYWTRSNAYWNDSDRYWDMYFNENSMDDSNTSTNQLERDRERTNR